MFVLNEETAYRQRMILIFAGVLIGVPLSLVLLGLALAFFFNPFGPLN